MDVGNSNYMSGSRFTMGPDGGSALSISVYVGSIDSAPRNQFQMAIYADNDGRPGARIATTSTGTLRARAWNTLAISAQLDPDTSYWLLYNTNGGSHEHNNLAGADSSDVLSGYGTFGRTFGSWPSVFGPASVGHGMYSMYLNYR
jgi:hypothetical protein